MDDISVEEHEIGGHVIRVYRSARGVWLNAEDFCRVLGVDISEMTDLPAKELAYVEESAGRPLRIRGGRDE